MPKIVNREEVIYNETLRAIGTMFKERSAGYLRNREAQLSYYQRNKEAYIARQKERYADPEKREQIIRRAVEWNRLKRVRPFSEPKDSERVQNSQK